MVKPEIDKRKVSPTSTRFQQLSNAVYHPDSEDSKKYLAELGKTKTSPVEKVLKESPKKSKESAAAEINKTFAENKYDSEPPPEAPKEDILKPPATVEEPNAYQVASTVRNCCVIS